MARSPIRSGGKDVISDDGAVLISIAQGEQRRFGVRCKWLTDLTGYTKTVKVVEGLNIAGDLVEAPLQIPDSPSVITLPVIDADVSDNYFEFVVTKSVSDAWTTPPSPDDPTYGFIALQVADAASGDNQQIFVPLRGMIEIRFNPVEES